MDEDEVKRAIEQGRLPLTSIDKAVIFVCIVFSFLILAWGANNHPHSMLYTTPIVIIVLVILGWKYFWENKRLITYQSSLVCDKKVEVLAKLLNELGLAPISNFWVKRNPHYYSFNYRKSWYANYNIQVLYNDSAYYVSSILGYGRSETFSRHNANEIIERIQKLEAEIK